MTTPFWPQRISRFISRLGAFTHSKTPDIYRSSLLSSKEDPALVRTLLGGFWTSMRAAYNQTSDVGFEMSVTNYVAHLLQQDQECSLILVSGFFLISHGMYGCCFILQAKQRD